MKNAIFLAAIALGTAWAVRGQFGHEHGAAWAGAIGCLTLVLISHRKDWYQNALSIVMAGGLGWGIGGVMSYGIVIGYCKALDFGNAYYGFLMLFVIGALYGFVGGGLMGISLSLEKSGKRVDWVRLIIEMVVGGVLIYFLLIEQWGYYMTPPRSELWAACLGVSLALTQYMLRENMKAALRVAIITAMGAGVGFSLGNLFQVLGGVYNIDFNWWNVMEYTLGFCGGAAMCYAIFTSKWEELPAPHYSWKGAFGVMAVLIPLIMWEQNISIEKMAKLLGKIAPDYEQSLPIYLLWVPLILIILVAVWQYLQLSNGLNYKNIKRFYLSFLGLYIFLSIVKTGAFLSTYRVEQYLYLLNFVLIIGLIDKVKPHFENRAFQPKKYLQLVGLILVLVAAITFIAISSHSEELGGGHYRYGPKAIVNEN